MTTKRELLSLAEQVRNTLDTSHGQCFPASKQLKKELAKNTDANKSEIDIEEVRMGQAGTLRHYVVAYPASQVNDVDTYGRVIIDITLDQYCDEFKEQGKVEATIGPKSDIPDINFYETKENAPYR